MRRNPFDLIIVSECLPYKEEIHAFSVKHIGKTLILHPWDICEYYVDVTQEVNKIIAGEEHRDKYMTEAELEAYAEILEMYSRYVSFRSDQESEHVVIL